MVGVIKPHFGYNNNVLLVFVLLNMISYRTSNIGIVYELVILTDSNY